MRQGVLKKGGGGKGWVGLEEVSVANYGGGGGGSGE
jgi:hypothetical protein